MRILSSLLGPIPRRGRERAAVVVELVGAPGAGKTTLLPTVMEACRSEGLRPYTVVGAARPFAARTAPGRLASRALSGRARSRALWGIFAVLRLGYAVGFGALRPALVHHLVVTQRGRPRAAAARERRVLHWYVRLMGSYAFLTSRAREGEALILDEGFVHRAVQLHASSVEVPAPSRIERYVGLIPRPDLLIHVRAPADVCERRIRSRGVWERLAGRDPRELAGFVANAHRATELVVDEAERAGWQVHAIDNDATADLDETRAQVLGPAGVRARARVHEGATR